MKPLRIGTRGSRLALWQAEHVQSRLLAAGRPATLQVIVTSGDRVQDRRLESIGGKGAFLKEIEEAMLAGEVDLAVHSLKDVPVALPEGLVLRAVLPRADARDALVSASGRPLRKLPSGARVGTTSLRRHAQIRELRPDLAVEDLRGNVDTRIRKLREGLFDAIVLAVAGLERLGLIAEATEVLDPDVFLPAPGQGAIAVECRRDDEATAGAVGALNHLPTERAVMAERSFLAVLGGGCNVPLGAYATPEGNQLRLRGFVASGGALFRGQRLGREPTAVGRELAEELIARGARAPSGP